MKSDDGVAYELVAELRGDVGEATLRFLEDDSMLALARRKDNALIGTAAPPYTQWE